MKIRVKDIWDAVNADINLSESGQLTKENFTNFLNRSQINLLRFLTGNLTDAKDAPVPFEKQKNKDYLKVLITKTVFNNTTTIPKDYYYWDNLYKKGKVLSDDDCITSNTHFENCDIQIPIFDGQKFKNRCKSPIKSMQPTSKNPIAKIIDDSIELEPKDTGTMVLEYIRYPKPIKLIVTVNQSTGEEIVDDVASGTMDWDLWALEYLTLDVINYHSKRTRENALKQFNTSDKKQD